MDITEKEVLMRFDALEDRVLRVERHLFPKDEAIRECRKGLRSMMGDLARQEARRKQKQGEEVVKNVQQGEGSTRSGKHEEDHRLF